MPNLEPSPPAQPAITPAQIAALLGWVAAQAIAFGWITDQQAQILVSVGATVLAAVLKLADAYLRGKRNEARAQIQAARFYQEGPSV